MRQSPLTTPRSVRARVAPGPGLLITIALACASPASAQLCGDVNDNGSVTTSDALNVLRVAVGQEVSLMCDGECASLDPRVTELETSLAATQTALAQVQAQLASTTTALTSVQALLSGVSRTEEALVLTGANLQVVDGSGTTAGPPNGLGNIIIGYNEATLGQDRTGSHNLVVGIEHDYTAFGGIVAGESNTISARGACVVGGSENVASAPFASVGGGFANEASGTNAVVSGGCENMSTNTYAAVSGGRLALASGQWSSVTGGYTNKATALYSSVSGGSTHTASTQFNWRAGSLSEAQ